MQLRSYKLCVKVALLLVLSLPLLGFPAGSCGSFSGDDETPREKAAAEASREKAAVRTSETQRERAVRTPETSGEKAAIRTAKDVPPTHQGLAQASPTGTTVPVSRPSSKLSVMPTSTTTPLRRITPFPRAKSVPAEAPTPTVSAARRPTPVAIDTPTRTIHSASS